MAFSFLLKGLIIGLSVSIPVGPIGVLCIKKTIAEGRMSGFTIGIGAAVADTCYGIIAGLGLTAISTFILSQSIWLKLVGGVFLLYLGVKLFFNATTTTKSKRTKKGYLSNFISTFLLTITNPITVIAFFAIFAAIGLGEGITNYASSLYLILGVFIGSISWWLILSSTVSLFQSKFTPSRLIWLNRLSGTVLFSFGIWAIYLGTISI